MHRKKLGENMPRKIKKQEKRNNKRKEREKDI
jgi:hypothetical protein